MGLEYRSSHLEHDDLVGVRQWGGSGKWIGRERRKKRGSSVLSIVPPIVNECGGGQVKGINFFGRGKSAIDIPDWEGI